MTMEDLVRFLQLHHRRNNQGNLKRNKLTASAQKGDCFWAVSITDVSTHHFFWLLKTSSSLWLASGCCTRFLHVSLLNSLGENRAKNIQTHDLFQELLESPSKKKINQKSVILSSTRKRARNQREQQHMLWKKLQKEVQADKMDFNKDFAQKFASVYRRHVSHENMFWHSPSKNQRWGKKQSLSSTLLVAH